MGKRVKQEPNKKRTVKKCISSQCVLADGEGFEPPDELPRRRFSKPVPSTRLSHPSDWRPSGRQAQKLHKIVRSEKSPFQECSVFKR